MHFIPLDKIQILRDKSKSGDSKATSILDAQLNDIDFEPLLNDYFNPKMVDKHVANEVEQDASQPNLDIKVIDFPEQLGEEEHHEHHKHNGLDIKMVDANGNEIVEEEPHHCEFGKSISEGIVNLVGEIDKAIIELTNNDEVNGSAKAGIMESLNELKKQSIAAIEKLKSIRKDIDKKQK